MSKVYISGKITGLDKKVYMERFAQAEKELTERGYSVVNPAKVNAQMPEDTTYEEYMKMSLAMLDICDCICMLAGWGDSNGAWLEYHYAKSLGKKVIFEAELKEEQKKEIWANAVLKDGKLIFWWTGKECKELWDFNKAFMNSGLNIKSELETGRYEFVKRQIARFEDGEEFYRQYEFYEPFKGIKPY